MITQTINKSIKEAEALGTITLRKMAVSMGWPVNVAGSLFAQVDKSSGTMTAQSSQDVFDFEYGTEKRPPKPVMRLFNDKYGLLHVDTAAKKLGM